MAKEYPHIIECTECGHRYVPIPLEDYPVDMIRLMEIAQTCPECQSAKLVLTQAPDAFEWYDHTIRKEKQHA